MRVVLLALLLAVAGLAQAQSPAQPKAQPKTHSQQVYSKATIRLALE
jgi:hypothetical protein